MSKKKGEIDPRVIRTRKLLRNSFVELLPKKGFNDLTIAEITENATLNRATFYLHYQDKNELLVDVFENLIAEAMPLPTEPFDQIDLEELHPIIMVLDHIAAYADFYCAILGEQGVPFLTLRIQSYIEEIINQWMTVILAAKYGKQFDHLPEIAVNFLAAGYLGVISWWLEHGMPYSAEVMEEQLIRVTNGGIEEIINFAESNDVQKYNV